MAASTDAANTTMDGRTNAAMDYSLGEESTEAAEVQPPPQQERPRPPPPPQPDLPTPTVPVQNEDCNAGGEQVSSQPNQVSGLVSSPTNEVSGGEVLSIQTNTGQANTGQASSQTSQVSSGEAPRGIKRKAITSQGDQA